MADIELQVQELTKAYSKQVQVGPISFDVKKGEFLSLLGPSGCGKTTILRCIAGFEECTGGSILLRGRAINGVPAHRRGIGLVFQNYALFPHLTVFDNISFGLKLLGLPKNQIEERVGRMLNLIGLPNLADRYPAQVSGGQQQRIAIARSLVLEPPILMFDEPLSNLDLKVRVQMRQELRNLQQQLGKTSIYVTHDQGEALVLSDRIAVLSQGRIEQIGPPHEIYESPKTRFVAEFIGNSNVISAQITDATASYTVATTRSGLRLRLHSNVGSVGSSVLLVLRPERIRIGPANSPSGDPNDLGATVESITYLGDDIHLRVQAECGEPFLVAVKNGRNLRSIKAGTAVRIIVDPEDIHVLER